MMVMVTMMMVVRFRESGSRQKRNHGKQQGLFHIFDDKRGKTWKVWVGTAITLLNGLRFIHFPILALRLRCFALDHR